VAGNCEGANGQLAYTTLITPDRARSLLAMTDVLHAFNTETLEDLYFHDFPEARDEADKKPKKKEIIDAIGDRIETLAIEIFLAALPVAMLKGIAAEHTAFKEGDNKSSRSVLTRRLTEQVVAAGLEEFIGTLKGDTLTTLSEDLETKNDKKSIASAVRDLAVQRYFGSYDVETLRALAEDLKLKKAAKSSSKRKLVEAIIAREDVEEEGPKKKKQKTVVDVGKKKPIEKGLTYDEIFQHYYSSELKDFAKQKGLKVFGKKPVLIKRILAYLDGETEGIMAGEKVEKKKKKKAATKKSTTKDAKAKDNGNASA